MTVKETGPVKKDLTLKKIFKDFDVEFNRRPPVGVSLGCDVKGVCPPKPDRDPVSMASGLQTRLGFQPGKMSRKDKRLLKRFTSTWCKKNLRPIRSDEHISFDAWMDKLALNKTYSNSRLQELRNVWESAGDLLQPDGNLKPQSQIPKKTWKKIIACKSFMKEEHYPGWKHPRAINSRSDLFKCLVGPMFDRVADEVFHYREDENSPSPFIKLVPVRDRPIVVKTHLYRDRAKYLVTDYSSFEAHFTKELMQIVEFELYKYMVKDHPAGDQFLSLISSFLGINQMIFKAFALSVKATRMSGEMNTSLGNGFSNMILALFLTWKNNPKAKLKGFFEGDDALFTVTPHSAAPSAKDYQNMGFNMKEVLEFDDLGEASFCGMLFNPEDPDLTIVTDPLKVIAKTGWGGQKYVRAKPRVLNALLRNKGYSVAYSYSGCPILDSFGQYILRATRADAEQEKKLRKHAGWWERHQWQLIDKDQLCSKPPRDLTRELVERLYGITVKVQLEVEAYFDSLSTVCELELPQLSWERSWLEYSAAYTVEMDDSQNCVMNYHINTKARKLIEKMSEQSPSFSKMSECL